MSARYEDRIDFYKFNRDNGRHVMKELDIRWVPSFLFYMPGEVLLRKVSGDDEATVPAMEEGIELIIKEMSKDSVLKTI